MRPLGLRLQGTFRERDEKCISDINTLVYPHITDNQIYFGLCINKMSDPELGTANPTVKYSSSYTFVNEGNKVNRL